MTEQQYKAAIERNLVEINWAKSQRIAYLEILNSGYSLYGDEFLGQCMIALNNDMLSHLIKILDTHIAAASFWSIHSIESKKVNDILNELGLSINILHTMSKKLRIIRNKTHFHIDKKSVIDPEQVWRSANITGDELDELILTLDTFFCELYRRDVSDMIPFYSYEGQDTKSIFDFAKENKLIRGY